MKCSSCQNYMIPCLSHVPDVKTWACQRCICFRIDGDDVVIPGGPGWLDRLRARAAEFLRDRPGHVSVWTNEAEAKRAWEQIVNSEDEDPRWSWSQVF